MLSSIPESRAQIRDAVTRSLKAWMYEAREASRAVGKGALDAMEQRGRRWAARKRKEVQLALAKINGPIELGISERHECALAPSPPFLSSTGRSTDQCLSWRLADSVLDNDNIKIDFKPLYTCIHIYDTLDAREELQLSYQADRRVGSPPPSPP